MERLLDHLRERMIRPLELLREFDKKNNGRITQAEFMSRLRVQFDLNKILFETK